MDNWTILLRMPAMRRSIRLGLPLLSCVLAMAACGGSSPVDPTDLPTSSPPPPPTIQTTVFQGTVAGARQSGTLEVTLQSAVALSSRSNVASRAQVPASGNLVLIGGGGNVGLDGNYNDSTRRVTLSGGGFSFDGRILEDGTELSGSYSDPAGAGGTFSTLNASATAVTAYCGTYAGDGEGTWNLALSDGLVAGTWSPGSSDPGGTLRGTKRGTLVTGKGQSNSGGFGTFGGTLRGTTLSGTWQASTSSDRGTFRGSTPCR